MAYFITNSPSTERGHAIFDELCRRYGFYNDKNHLVSTNELTNNPNHWDSIFCIDMKAIRYSIEHNQKPKFTKDNCFLVESQDLPSPNHKVKLFRVEEGFLFDKLTEVKI